MSFHKVRVDGVEERGQAVIRGVTLRGCVDALGLRMDTAELRKTTVEMACMQYFDMDRRAAMDKSARTEALLLVQMDTQLYPEHEWRFPMYFYGEVNIATAVAFLLVPETREALNALVLSYKVGPGHLDPCFFVQGMSIAELLWVFAIGAHFEATKPAVGFHIVGELVLAIALMLQNHWLHDQDGGAARVACVSRLVCQVTRCKKTCAFAYMQGSAFYFSTGVGVQSNWSQDLHKNKHRSMRTHGFFASPCTERRPLLLYRRKTLADGGVH